MNCYYLITFTICFYFMQVNCSGVMNNYMNKKLQAYLDKHSTYVEEKLTKQNKETVLPNRSFKFNEDVKNITYTKYHKNAYSFSLFNSSYILTDQELYVISLENMSLSIHPSSNLIQQQQILFIKTVEYEEIGILLVCSKFGETKIYGIMNNSNNNEYFLIQTIYNHSPSDASFIIRRGNLYLVITNQYRAFTIIYQFIGSHFDEMNKFETNGAKQIKTFPVNNVEIIIVLQYLPDKKLSSIIFEFNNLNEVKMIQKIPTSNPQQALTYIYKNQHYVVILDEANNHTIYYWNGFELVETGSVDYELEKAVIININNSAIIVKCENSQLLAFAPTQHNFQLLTSLKFTKNFTAIFDIQTLHDNAKKTNNNILIITGTDTENMTHSKIITFNEHFNELESRLKEDDAILICLINLEQKIYSQRQQFNALKEKSKKILMANEPTIFNGRINVAAPVFMKSAKINSKYSINKYQDDLTQINTALDQMNLKLATIKSSTTSFINNRDILILNGTIIMESTLSAKQLFGYNLNIKIINEKSWTPEQWLSYSQAQSISGPVVIKQIITEKCETSQDNTLFNDIMSTNDSQKLTGSVKLNNLKVMKIYTKSINDVPLELVYQKSTPVVIKGTKYFQNLNIETAQINTINNNNTDDIMSFFADPQAFKYNFNQNLQIENLWTEEIDDINWNNFYDSIFRVGVTNTIEGTLKFPQLITDKLILNTLAGVKIDNILTSSTEQIIHSSIRFNHIYTQNIFANTVNGLSDFTSSVSTFVNKNLTGPVRIDSVEVEENLRIPGPLNKSFLIMKNEHIVGTNESDLLQIYRNQVRIKGNLFVKNLALKDSAELFLANNKIDKDIINRYWTKNTIQTIPVHFEATKGLTSSHLNTNVLNNVKMSSYMLNNQNDKDFTRFYFDNVTILGNLNLNDQIPQMLDLKKIQQEAVKINGSFRVNNQKTYINTLKIDHLEAVQLNDLEVSSILIKNNKTSTKITGTKSFKTLLIDGDLTTKKIYTKVLNSADIKELQENTLYIDQNFMIDKLNFKNVIVENLQTSKINEHNFKEYILKLTKKYSATSFNDLYIDGDLFVEHIDNIPKINNNDLSKLLINNSSIHNGTTTLDDVNFLKKVKVKNLFIKTINNADFSQLSKRLLYKKWHQEITKPYKFRSIKILNNLIAPKINNISIENLIDISNPQPQSINAGPNELIFTTTTLGKSLSIDSLQNDLDDAIRNFRNPPTKTWETILITGNATFWDNEHVLSKIFDKTVTTSSTKNIITGYVEFKTNIAVNNITTQNSINNINIQNILDDALFKSNSDKQVITANKTFQLLSVSDATIADNAQIPVINDFDISEINEKIIHKNNINNVTIKGQKTCFGGLQTNRLISDFVSNIRPETLVSLANPKQIPNAIFESVQVDSNFKMNFVNNINLDGFLNERINSNQQQTQTTNATYVFHNVRVLENLRTPQINNIQINDIVFDTGVQDIEDTKRFSQDLEIVGNLTAPFINGMEIQKMYKDAVIKGVRNNIIGDMIMQTNSVVNNDVEAQLLNGYPIENLTKIMNKESSKTETDLVFQISDKIVEIIERKFYIMQNISTEYMYMEQSTDFQISIPNTVNAEAMSSNGHILLHIQGEEFGSYCSLPEQCKCPIQYTVEISPKHSINEFGNKGSQRIFSYNEDDITIHFITNSVSTSTECRTNSTKTEDELSYLTWNVINLSTDLQKDGFYLYPKYFKGYISDIEFFTVNGKTYIVVARYYDSVLDSHDLNCIILKFNSNKTELEEIQIIKTRASSTLHLFYTAQGVVLIVGNNKDSEQFDIDADTSIYRFSTEHDQFILLRNVPSYGCSAAVGVTLGLDSLIVLAHKQAPIQILIYNPYFDNYYFYQSFQLDSRVLGVSVFYTGNFGLSDAYLCVTTRSGSYFVYSFRFIEGWKLESKGEIDGLTKLTPFQLNNQLFMFATSTQISTLFNVVKYGSKYDLIVV